jgi:hypothetical protein
MHVDLLAASSTLLCFSSYLVHEGYIAEDEF